MKLYQTRNCWQAILAGFILLIGMSCAKPSGIHLLSPDGMEVKQIMSIQSEGLWYIFQGEKRVGEFSIVRKPVKKNDQDMLRVHTLWKDVFSSEGESQRTLEDISYYDKEFRFLFGQFRQMDGPSTLIVKNQVIQDTYKIAFQKNALPPESFEYDMAENEAIFHETLYPVFHTDKQQGTTWIFPGFDRNELKFYRTRSFIAGKQDIPVFQNSVSCFIIQSMEMSQQHREGIIGDLFLIDAKPDLDTLQKSFDLSRHKTSFWIDARGNVMKGEIHAFDQMLTLQVQWIKETSVSSVEEE